MRGHVRASWAARAAAGIAERDLDTLREELARQIEEVQGLKARHSLAVEASKEFLEAQSKVPAADLVTALAHETLAAAEESLPSLPQGGDGAPDPKSMGLVTSSAGLVHRVLVGPDEVSLELMSAFCGWRFGKSPAKLSYGVPPRVYERVCARCFPALRRELEAERVR